MERVSIEPTLVHEVETTNYKIGVLREYGELTEESEKDLQAPTSHFDSSYLLKQNCLKLMNGEFGGGFYVRYLQDSSTKIGWLQLVIQYPDGTCKPVTLYKNQFLETDFDSDGIWKENKANAKYISPWDKQEARAPYALEKYASPDMPIPGQVLWNRICEAYRKIPVVTIYQKSTLEQVYQELIEQATECAKLPGYEFMNEKDRCYISKDVFCSTAEGNNFKVDDLKHTFDLMGLLVKDKGTKGYQYSKRVKGESRPQRFYVLRKKNETAPSEDCVITECENLEFETKVKTLAEQQKERFDQYVQRVNDAVEKSGIQNQEVLVALRV